MNSHALVDEEKVTLGSLPGMFHKYVQGVHQVSKNFSNALAVKHRPL